MSRETLLSYSYSQLELATHLAHGSTSSALRVRPTQIGQWDTFGQEVLQYWANVPTNDKAALVFWMSNVTHLGAYYTSMPASNETGVRQALDILPFQLHKVVTMGPSGQPRPTDTHSDIIPFQRGWDFEGEPDYIFWSQANQRIHNRCSGREEALDCEATGYRGCPQWSLSNPMPLIPRDSFQHERGATCD
jgi:hypothetical protein